MTYKDWTFSGAKRTGRPPKGPTVKAAMQKRVVDLLDSITERMPQFTSALRHRTQAGLRFQTSEGKAWSRADVVAAVVAAGAPQFAHYVLDEPHAVLKGMPCPLCHGFVDGPHATRCGYFGPLAEYDPHFEARLRYVVSEARRRGVQFGEGNWIDSPI